MARWDEYGLKTGTSARDEVLIKDSDTNTNKRITVGDIQEFANGKMLEKENTTLNTEAKTLIGAINEVDAKNTEQDEKLNAIENKFPSYVKKTDVDSTLSVAGSPADAKVVGDSLKNEKTERQAEIDVERKRINDVYSNKLLTLDEIDLVTEEGFFVDALAVKELNSKTQNLNSPINIEDFIAKNFNCKIIRYGRLRILHAYNGTDLTAENTVIYTLKEQDRPIKECSFGNWVIKTSSSTYGSVYLKVDTDGTVTITKGSVYRGMLVGVWITK